MQYINTPEIISLNLILDYPVKWSKYKVLRDFIQNFYDSIGRPRWHKDFSYEVINRQLIFKALNVDFSYDWLIHIGASTKRDNSTLYAGYFGEGFKIASLCAVRDFQWKIEMASRDWELEVITNNINVDNKTLTTLAYSIIKKTTVRKDTELRIYPFQEYDVSILESALLSFFYEENPLFGEEIWNSPEFAVFQRSKIPKPLYYPSTNDYSGQGIIFAGYQALGSFEYPLIFCHHRFRLNDRERNTFFKMDVVKVINEVVNHVSPEAAAKILYIFKNLWYRYPQKKYDFESYYSIINKLVRIISHSSEQTSLWKERNPHLLVARSVKRKDIAASNLRRQALNWLRLSDNKYRLVQEGFIALGYPILEEVCEKNGGFSIVREPLAEEIPLIKLLEEFTSKIFSDFFGNKSLPSCKIINTEKAVWSGMALCVPLKKYTVNPAGIKIRFTLPYIAMKSRLFTQSNFHEALSTYLHELAHVFGGDQSASFSRGVSEILDYIIKNAMLVEDFAAQWDAHFLKAKVAQEKSSTAYMSESILAKDWLLPKEDDA
ncbi:MAG: hypothetical protein WA125_14225 [Desulfosporosinus sp.]